LSQVLEAKAVKPDENAMYLYTNFLEMIWPFDAIFTLFLNKKSELVADEGPLKSFAASRRQGCSAVHFASAI
jgi:hypothetical protein